MVLNKEFLRKYLSGTSFHHQQLRRSLIRNGKRVNFKKRADSKSIIMVSQWYATLDLICRKLVSPLPQESVTPCNGLNLSGAVKLTGLSPHLIYRRIPAWLCGSEILEGFNNMSSLSSERKTWWFYLVEYLFHVRVNYAGGELKNVDRQLSPLRPK